MNGKTETFIDTAMVEWSQTMRDRVESCKAEDKKEHLELMTFMDQLIYSLGEGTMECTPAEMIIVNEPIVTSVDFLKQMTDELFFFEKEELDSLFPGQELDWNAIRELFHEAMVKLTKKYEEECFDTLAYDEQEENKSFKEFKKHWGFTRETEPELFKVYYKSEMTRLKTKIKNEQKRINYLESLT